MTIKTINEKMGEGVVKALRARHFDAIYCKNADEARMEALSRIPAGARTKISL